MSFDVTSLFTNVALDLIINIILRQIYNLNEVNTNIPKQEMKNEKSYFIVHHKMYNNEIYKQTCCTNGFHIWTSNGRYIYGGFRNNSITNFQ